MTENSTETTEVTSNADVSPESEPADTLDAASTNVDPDICQADREVHDEPESFSRDYVEKLRQENGKYRQRAGEADSFAKRLHTELVRATGRLADPTDLPYDAEHLADADKMAGAIEDLLTAKPHLASRRPIGEIGQGATSSGGTVDLAAILRGKAG
jgi:hypothetical protein